MVERKFLPFMPDSTIIFVYIYAFITVFIFLLGIKRNVTRYDITIREFVKNICQNLKINKKGISDFISYIILQKKTQEQSFGKIGHSTIYFGCLILLIGTTIVAIDEDILSKISDLKILRGNFYILFEFVLDTAGIFVFFGAIYAIYRRFIVKPKYLYTDINDYIIPILLIIIISTGFVLEAYRLHLDNNPVAKYSYVGNFISSKLFLIDESLSGINNYRLLWYFHFIMALLLICLIPFSKLKHIFLIPLNFIVSPPKKRHRNAKLDVPFNILEIDENDEECEALENIGVGSIAQIRWNDRLQISSCINCGRCEEVCPANSSGRLLSPRNVIQKIARKIENAENKIELFEHIIKTEEIWGCTNCYACIEVCPAFIRHVDKFLDFRRFIVNTNFEDEAKINIFGNIDRNGNPYGLASYQRTEWLSDHEVSTIDEEDEFDYLYFIGCSSSYDQRCQEITKSVINILNHANINFVILGEHEICCGEPAKRMGEEGLFQMTAIQNIEKFEEYGVKNIIVHCPHCYNMLKHEYPEFNGNYNVIYHADMIDNLLKSQSIKLKTNIQKTSLTYHDPCNIGRLNGIFNSPREVINRVGQLREMDRNKESSFCCGGGGGNAFFKIPEKRRISQIRIQEALNTGASSIVAACPFCMIMLEDAKGNIENSRSITNVYDIAELVSMHLN